MIDSAHASAVQRQPSNDVGRKVLKLHQDAPSIVSYADGPGSEICPFLRLDS